MSNLQHILNNCSNIQRVEFTEEDSEILSDAFVSRSLAEGEVLLREGEIDDALSIVVDGELTVTRKTGGDEEVTIHFLKQGDIAGAMGFIDGNSHSATLRANKKSDVMTLKRNVLEKLIGPHPFLVYKLMRLIIRSVHKTVLRMDQQFVEMTNYITKEHGRY